MLRRTALAAILSLAAAGAHAAAPKKDDKGDVGQYVELQPVGLPIVTNGRLVNYVFVYVRINLTSSANVARLREKEPFFRDALVRAGHRTPFTDPKDLGRVNEAGLAVDRKIWYGKRAQEIVQYSMDQQVDLIVMSSHKIDAAQPVQSLGSLSYQVSLFCQCPVLLVK